MQSIMGSGLIPRMTHGASAECSKTCLFLTSFCGIEALLNGTDQGHHDPCNQAGITHLELASSFDSGFIMAGSGSEPDILNSSAPSGQDRLRII